MWGTLYIVVHEAQHLPGDPTLVGVSRIGDPPEQYAQYFASLMT